MESGCVFWNRIIASKAPNSAREIADQEYRLTAGGYDGRAILTLDEIAKIPVVRPTVLVTISKKARSQPRRNGKVKILAQDGVPVYRAPVVSIEVGRKAGKLRENVERPKAAQTKSAHRTRRQARGTSIIRVA